MLCRFPSPQLTFRFLSVTSLLRKFFQKYHNIRCPSGSAIYCPNWSAFEKERWGERLGKYHRVGCCRTSSSVVWCDEELPPGSCLGVPCFLPPCFSGPACGGLLSQMAPGTAWSLDFLKPAHILLSSLFLKLPP